MVSRAISDGIVPEIRFEERSSNPSDVNSPIFVEIEPVSEFSASDLAKHRRQCVSSKRIGPKLTNTSILKE